MMNNIYKIIIAIYLHTQLSCFNFIYVVTYSKYKMYSCTCQYSVLYKCSHQLLLLFVYKICQISVKIYNNMHYIYMCVFISIVINVFLHIKNFQSLFHILFNSHRQCASTHRQCASISMRFLNVC